MPATTTQPNLLKLERTFNAAPERLWSFWTDPKKYAKWLNPAPIDLVIHEWDLREGGKVRFDMPQPDGSKNPQEGVFHELKPCTKLVSGDADKSFLLTARFEPVGPKQTRLTVEVVGVPPEWHQPAFVGWSKGFNKLERELENAVGTVEGRSVRLERFVRAPPAQVWAAWSTGPTLERWFWPSGKGKIKEFSFKPGGRLVMGHESQPWTATWEWIEIVPQKRIVFHDVWDDGSGHKATGTIEFHAEGSGTRMVVTHGPFPATGPYKLEDAIGGFAVVADNLAALLETPGEGGFMIERTFKAAPEKVWRMWTTPEGIMKWWALSAKNMGYDFKVLKMDVRPGGMFAFSMKSKEHDLVNGGTYRIVDENRELAWTWHFDIFLQPGEKPFDIPIRVTLEPTDSGGTKMTFAQGPLGNKEHTEGSRQGVQSNLDQLEKALDR